MTKPIVFISHTSDEAAIAEAFQELIGEKFLGLFEVFVSSDGKSIRMGQHWLESVSEALQSCVLELIVASPMSVSRPWVNFEAGAAWVRGIPIIPLCHSGMTPSQLPIPMNLLQGARATDEADLRRVFATLAHALGARAPDVDFSKFISDVNVFETGYLFWDKVNAALQAFHELDPRLTSTLFSGAAAKMQLDEHQINNIGVACRTLAEHKLVESQLRLAAAYGPGGASFLCHFIPSPALGLRIKEPGFKKPR